MKKLSKHFLLLLVGGVLLYSCNNSGSTKTETSGDTTINTMDAKQVNYPYTIDHPDNWETGSQQNTLNALNALKAWETKDMNASMKYFGDSIRIRFDGLDKMVSNDSLKSMIAPPAGADYSVKMQDWESVTSKDKKEEYVTLWYREFSKNAKGDKDSIDVVNDLKMKDGKIIGLDEYLRKLH